MQSNEIKTKQNKTKQKKTTQSTNEITGVLSVVQTGVLAALHAVHEYISTAVAVAVEGGMI